MAAAPPTTRETPVRDMIINTIINLRWIWLLLAIGLIALAVREAKLYERVEEIEREAARKGLFGEDAEGYQLSRLLEEVRSLLRPWDWIEIAVTIALISLFVLSFILS